MSTPNFDVLIPKIQTPYKLNRLVIQPSYKPGEFDSHAVDAPFLFRHEGKYYMTFIGWDSIGYQTGLASSTNLIDWEKEGIILHRAGPGSVTQYNAALTSILRDNHLFGTGELRRVAGRFVGTYHAYPGPGYESGPACIGICYSDDLRHWEIQTPCLQAKDGESWEMAGLYKSWLMEDNGVYYLFYNAKNQTAWPWLEQIGFATSTDLVHWERFKGNPVVRVGPKGSFDDIFASDPCVFRDGENWVMFYFGNSTDGHAREGAAFSTDLRTWIKSTSVLIDVGPMIDSQYAHKPGIIAANDTLYHFYCAVSPWRASPDRLITCDETRGITVAASSPISSPLG